MWTAGVMLKSVIKVCFLLLAGGLAAQHSTLPIRSDVSSLLLVASLCALFLRPARPGALVTIGYVLFHMAGQELVDRRLAERFEGDSMLTVVRIADFPQIKGDSIIMTVEPLDDRRLPPRSRISWFEAPVLPAIGEVWELELRLRRPRGNANPGVFDVETWLFRENIHATGYVVGGKRNRLLWGGTASPLEAFRARFETRVRGVTESRDAAAVLLAVGSGARHRISPTQWERFAISGTSHLVAISGLHVGLAGMVAFGVAWSLAGMLPLRGGHLVPALAAGVMAAGMYAGISGLGVPAQRAALMLGIAALAAIRRRQPAAGEAVALAGAVIFVINPVASLSPGFCLSFGAVILLLWLARRRGTGTSGVRRAASRLLVLQVFLMFGLLPLTAMLFQRFAIIATPVNFVAVPLFSFLIVPLTLMGMVVGEVSEGAAAPLLRIAGKAIDLLDAGIGWAAGLPFADLSLARFAGPALLLLALPLAWVVLPRGWPGRGIACIGIVAIALWRPAPPPAGCFDAWVLDVGQGLAVVIQTHSDVLLYDTGVAWRGGGSVAEQVIEPFLASRGIRSIDGLFVSHADLDHSGGVAHIVQTMRPRFIVSGEPLNDAASLLCKAGTTWWSGAVRFAVLHPAADRPEDGNDASCVVRVSAGPYRILLTGDIEKPAERRILQRGVSPGAEVVVVPHHGSSTSSSVPFVDSVNPLVAIVSAAHANRWGFPRPDVVARWESVGAKVLNTARHGAVRIRVCAADGIAATDLERERRRRFWHAE